MNFFANEETAKGYEQTPGFESDRTVSLIGMFGPKPVSKLEPNEAEALVKGGVNYIRPVAQAELPVGTAQKKSDDVSQA